MTKPAIFGDQIQSENFLEEEEQSKLDEAELEHSQCDSEDFVVPTNEELGRLELEAFGLSDSGQTQSRGNGFAGLLNRGSPQE